MVAIVTCAPNAFAVRPFITDDARVVGKRQAQLESWARWDELSIGAVHGLAIHDDRHRCSLAAPLLQAKLLLHEARSNQWPGVAIIAGSFLPFGFGGFQSQRTASPTSPRRSAIVSGSRAAPSVAHAASQHGNVRAYPYRSCAARPCSA